MNSYKKFIVVTTINPKTEAIKKFEQLHDWTLIVVADRKTPDDYKDLQGFYMDCAIQRKLYPELSELLGWNTVDRRNLGFLYAYQKGADIVAMVDDDNIPYDNWGKNLHINKEIEVDYYETNQLAFDPLSVTKYKHLWHRGFPVELYQHKNDLEKKRKKIKPLVQADLWDNDPDVDAICRMMYRPKVKFTRSRPYAGNRITPFNMQNTFVARDALKYVISIPNTGRMCDIWGAFYFQAYYPNRTIFSKASVEHTQERDWHSLINDLQDEILGYNASLRLLKELYYNPTCLFHFIDKKATEFIKLYQSYFE